MVLGLPFGDSRITGWLDPIFKGAEENLGRAPATFSLFGIDGLLILVSTTLAVIGVVVAWRLFGVDWWVFRHAPEPERVTRLANANGATRFLYRASLNKWWFDDLYDLLFIRIGGRVAAGMWWFDRRIIDGTVNGVGAVVTGGGRGLRHVQTGRVQNYALGIAIGLLVMAGSYFLIAAR
jgi:NADH-quinone oxidoreductase subunit L